MAELKSVSLPHGTIPTQMFGNVNLQNAVMYVNENFADLKDGVNDAISATNAAMKEKASSDHKHDDVYAALDHTHGMDAVTGLNAALDDKAALNHEHSQYLSSLPAHYHDVAGISGLGEQLQSKAEKVHTHTMAQVENLATELGVKAATSYVDQQISQVGGTIKTIADQEIEEKVGLGMGDNPTDNKNASTGASEPNGLTFTDWTAGGESGLKLRAYVLVEEDLGGEVHILQPLDIDISKGGVIRSVKKVPDTSATKGAGIWIGA